MLTNLPVLSPDLPFVYRLDVLDSAVEDLKTFNKNHISFVLIGDTSQDETTHDRKLSIINKFCSEPTTDNRMRALWIQEGEILTKVTPELVEILKNAFPQVAFTDIQAFTTLAGDDVPFGFLQKGTRNITMTKIKTIMNNAVIASPPPTN